MGFKILIAVILTIIVSVAHSTEQWRWSSRNKDGTEISLKHYNFRKNLYEKMWGPFRECRDNTMKLLKSTEDIAQAIDSAYEKCKHLEPDENEFNKKVQDFERNNP